MKPLLATKFAVAIVGIIMTPLATLCAPSSTPTAKSVEGLALQWFERMRTGQIDRTQLAAAYSAQLTEDAVKKMSAYLNDYKYGASPIGAQVLQTRAIGAQTFYDVKLSFPRGDAASLLIGFNSEGQITGIVLTGMAGD